MASYPSSQGFRGMPQLQLDGQADFMRRLSFFEMVPAAARNTIVPCHHIPLDARGHTIASIYRKNTQKDLDEHYREWLSALIQKTQQH
jgi:hypothetical protein